MKTLKIAVLAALLAAALPAADVTFKQHSDNIEVLAGGKPLTTLYFGPETRKPYLHPLRAADGTIVTRQYPMRDDIPGEAHDHPHHRGLWFSHGDVNGFDFWANEPDQEPQNKKGRIVLKGVHKAGDGMIRADFQWQTPDGDVLLTDDRTYKFTVNGNDVIIDNDIHLKAETKPVKFGDTKEGTFAIRIHPTMREQAVDKSPGKGVIVASTGAKGEKNTWGKAAEWVDYSGPIDGKTYGIAIMDYPTNPKHPTYWHVRAYGLFAANIFGEHDFFGDKTRDGSVTLKPGETMDFKYRVVIHPGDAAAANVAKMYQSWAGGAGGAKSSSSGAADAAIAKADKAWAKAVVDRDLKALGRIYDDGLIYAHSTGSIDTKADYLANLKSGKQKYDAIEFQKQTIRVHGDSAVSHSIVVMKGTNPAGPFDNRLMMIHTWVKEGGAWKLAAHQTTDIGRH
jgi:ketosteroid isomerase-like protein